MRIRSDALFEAANLGDLDNESQLSQIHRPIRQPAIVPVKRASSTLREPGPARRAMQFLEAGICPLLLAAPCRNGLEIK